MQCNCHDNDVIAVSRLAKTWLPYWSPYLYSCRNCYCYSAMPHFFVTDTFLAQSIAQSDFHKKQSEKSTLELYILSYVTSSKITAYYVRLMSCKGVLKIE